MLVTHQQAARKAFSVFGAKEACLNTVVSSPRNGRLRVFRLSVWTLDGIVLSPFQGPPLIGKYISTIAIIVMLSFQLLCLV